MGLFKTIIFEINFILFKKGNQLYKYIIQYIKHAETFYNV
jgi:hypothetical protein